MSNTSPREAWTALVEGNRRFVADTPEHPSQGIDHRASLVGGQHPSAIVFGCADSRVAAEIIFDQGLGDMFVVRTAGHVVDSAVLGSIEFGVEVLNTPLIVVLGHDSCGAVKATIDALEAGTVPGGFIRDIVERVTPSVLEARREGIDGVDEVVARHVLETGNLLTQRSPIIERRIESGKLAIVGATYKLSDGCIELQGAIGDVGETGVGGFERRATANA